MNKRTLRMHHNRGIILPLTFFLVVSLYVVDFVHNSKHSIEIGENHPQASILVNEGVKNKLMATDESLKSIPRTTKPNDRQQSHPNQVTGDDVFEKVKLNNLREISTSKLNLMKGQETFNRLNGETLSPSPWKVHSSKFQQLDEYEDDEEWDEFHNNSRGSKKIGILAAYTGRNVAGYIANYKWTIRNWQCYAALNDEKYDYILEVGNFPYLPPRAAPHYVKPFLIKKHLPKYEWIMWVDLDVLITNLSLPLEPYLSSVGNRSIVVQDADFALMNNGIFFMRNSNDSFKFLDVWIDNYKYCGPYRWFAQDQNAWYNAIAIMLNETKPSTIQYTYDNHCSIKPECSKSEECFASVIDQLVGPIGNRRWDPIFQFWHDPNGTHPYRAFGFFKDQSFLDDRFIHQKAICIPTDLLCHVKHNTPMYKRISTIKQNVPPDKRICSGY